MHLAMYCDEVVIRICRGIDIGEIYGVLKQECFKVDLARLSQPRKENNDNLETRNQPLVPTTRAVDNGKFRGPENIATDSADNNAGLEASTHKATGLTTAMTSADSIAQSHYDNIRREIRITSPVHQSLEQAGGAPSDQATPLAWQKTRAATCEILEHVLSVPHRPRRCIKVSTILNLIPTWARRVLARMPFLLRLILMPLSYLHPIKMASTAMSASGSWLANVMQDSIYSHYAEDRDDIKQLQQMVSDWLTNATFCLDLANIQGLARVSLRAPQDITSSWSCASSAVMRIEPDTNVVAPALRIEGADATCTIPSYLLPYHEHLMPPQPSGKAGCNQGEAVEKSPGQSQEMSAADNAACEADTAAIELSTHLSFPAILDSAMVDFFGDLVESTIVMEIEDVEAGDDQSSPTNESTLGRARTKVADHAHDMRKSIKKGMKKAAFSARNDDRIPSIVRKLAEQLESLHGDVGYSGSITIPLGSFRGSVPLPSKLLA